jgi:ABC-type antimicrobial peptide transport system permease subunit
MARRLWPNQDPLGKRFRISTNQTAVVTVIGVVRDATYRLNELGGTPIARFFLSYSQADQGGARTFHIRTLSAHPESLAATVETAIRRIDPSLPVYDVFPLDFQIGNSSGGFGGAKGAAMISGIVGVVALALALVGTYGVLSFSVRERSRELGIRLALGFEPGGAFRMMLKETWLMASIGTMAGLAVGIGAGRLIGRFLFGVSPHDLPTILTVAAAIGLVSTIVGFFPARRASRVDPAVTLRYE